jgi:hypothetical protein
MDRRTDDITISVEPIFYLKMCSKNPRISILRLGSMSHGHNPAKVKEKIMAIVKLHLVTIVGKDEETGVYDLEVYQPSVPDVFDLFLQSKVTILALVKKTVRILSAAPTQVLPPTMCPHLKTCRERDPHLL